MRFAIGKLDDMDFFKRTFEQIQSPLQMQLGDNYIGNNDCCSGRHIGASERLSQIHPLRNQDVVRSFAQINFHQTHKVANVFNK